MGWNLGEKGSSSHLLDPFTSEPIKGTKNNNIKVNINKIVEIFIKKVSLNNEKVNIINRPSKIYMKCLMKK